MPHAIIFFDGVCNLCTGSVRFVISRDKKDLFRFAALQSDTALQQLQPFGFLTGKLNTVMLLENGRLYQRSAAALRIARRLNGGWPLLYAFIIVPAFIRDFVYDLIAENRYRIWGKQESCMIPTPALKAKFL
ncbi:thiol-disulfide oxidoreductase DCC family protein [Pedobacter sp. L105]|uniref:thiol-disulfide oxidoreductase DCC family protein n=1 Tax=Pedobacter sp. L105 TaxID=1641871 RepID=UPI00131E4F2D|nr:thiol-disulfide oxidoreductase DCC family protein [Pedobacter sp. L105]